jgi:hypothetical protein
LLLSGFGRGVFVRARVPVVTPAPALDIAHRHSIPQALARDVR